MATESITIIGENSRITSTTAGEGIGGKIILTTPDLTLADQGQIRAESTGMGNAGDIRIAIDRMQLTGHAQISTEASSSDGGDIDIAATSRIHLTDSTITASVGGDNAGGGNIGIEAELVLLENSEIIANASGQDSRGGNIAIDTTGYLADIDSQVSASSALGIDGTVEIQTLVDLSGNVIQLSQDFVGRQELLQNQCVVQLREGVVSSFVQRGRTGIPAAPGGFLPGLQGQRL